MMKLYGGTIDDQLTGMSFSDRYRSLNDLVSKSNPQLLAFDSLKSWTDKSQADQIYIAKLADRCKNARVLCDIFKTENDMVITIALNAIWMFEGETENDVINADYFIKEIFSTCSYHTLCRIISHFGAHLKNEKLAEDLFTKTQPLYDFNLVIKLLPKCSIAFIQSQISNMSLIVPCQQLIYIYRRDPELVIEYLLEYLRDDNFKKIAIGFYPKESYERVYTLIARDFPEKFLSLYDQHKSLFNFKLGGRLTSGILKIRLDKIVEDPNAYLKILHLPTLLGRLKGEQLESFVLKLMPLKEKDFSYGQVAEVLKNMKPSFRMQFLLKVYSIKYDGASFINSENFSNWDMIIYLPADIRNNWVNLKIESIKSSSWLKEDHYLMFASTDVAIPRLMTLSKAASDMEYRISLLERMIDCCKVNNDTECLLKILKYTAQRHRNDQDILRYRFLDHLQSSFQLHKLSAEHWEIINEMIEFMCVSKEIENHGWQHFLSSFLEPYLQYCLDNNQPIDSVIDKFLAYNINSINLLIGVPKHEFVVLDAFFQKYKLLIEGNTEFDKVEGMINKLLLSYTKRSDSATRSVTECTWLMDVIKEYMDKVDYLSMRSTLYLLSKDKKARIMFADKLFQSDSSEKYLVNYLRHDADVVVRNVTYLMESCLYPYRLPGCIPIFQKIRAYMNKPLGELFVKTIKEYCTAPERQAIMTVALSSILDIREAEDLIRKHIPTQTKVDLRKHTQEYQDGEVIAKNFRFMNPPISYDILLSFAKGDYLKFTIGSVLSLPFKKISTDTLDFINKLMAEPVSAKKHGVRLAYFLYPKKDILGLYKKLWDSEKNCSIREVIFQRTFRLMQIGRCIENRKEIWLALKGFVKSFNELDKPLFCYLTQIQSIPSELVSDFSETCWEALKFLRSQKCVVDSEIVQLSSSFISNMQLLSDEFCESLIEEYMESVDKDLCESGNLLEFLVCHIVHTKNSELQTTHLERTCNLFAKLIEEKWNRKVNNSFIYRNTVRNFVQGCCQASLSSNLEVDPTSLLRCILEMLSSNLPFGSYADLEFLIGFALVHRRIVEKHPGNDSALCLVRMKEFGNSLGEYFIETSQKFGCEIYAVLAHSFNVFYRYILCPDIDPEDVLMHFISGLVENKNSQCFMLAIDLLPSNIEPDSKRYPLYKAIIDEINSKGNITTKIMLDHKFPFDSDELFSQK